MSNRLNLLFIGVFLVLMTGCGQTVVQKLNVTPAAPYNAVGQGKTIVILPFADYSEGDISTAQKRNIVISEALTDKLSLNGFGMPIPEDVFLYLVDEEIISLTTGDKDNSLQHELTTKEWSDEMKDLFRGELAEQNRSERTKQDTTSSEKGLTAQQVQKIGTAFNADYVMRGRIIEYKTRQDTMNPLKAGIIPFVVSATSRTLFGFIDADNYDGKSFFLDRSVMGDVDLRVWVQDAATGDVLWTNHTTIDASRATVWADPQHDVLFAAAVERSACLLIYDFATYGVK